MSRDLATDQQQLGQAELADFEAAGRELFVFVEAGDRFGFEHANSGEPPVIGVEGGADLNLHPRPRGIELGPKPRGSCRTDSALLLPFREHRQRHRHAAEDDLVAFFARSSGRRRRIRASRN